MTITKRFFILILGTLSACNPSGKQEGHQSEAAATDNPNQVLYDQVMDMHDEIMPHIEDIYQLKQQLKEKIDNKKELSADKKQQLELIISQLDSAEASMMDWMHEFNPLPDSVDQEKARLYLETEMEKIKKVKELMNGSIEKAKGVKN